MPPRKRKPAAPKKAAKQTTAKRLASKKTLPTAGSARTSALLKSLPRCQDLRLELPKLAHMNPGLVEIGAGHPESVENADGESMTVLGTNTAGLWFVHAEDGSVHLVDDCERELGLEIFPTLEAFVREISRQNP